MGPNSLMVVYVDPLGIIVLDFNECIEPALWPGGFIFGVRNRVV